MHETLFMIGSFISVAIFFIVFFILLSLKIYIGAGILCGVFFIIGGMLSCFYDRKSSGAIVRESGTTVKMSVHMVKPNDIKIIEETKQTFRGESKVKLNDIKIIEETKQTFRGESKVKLNDIKIIEETKQTFRGESKCHKSKCHFGETIF
jgi:hypothetical protein